MSKRLVGLKAPEFKMNTVSGDGKNFKEVTLEDYKGKWLVMFFYPLDFTFVCPTEISGFNKVNDNFKELNAELLAVSTDSVYSHQAWIGKPANEGGLGQLAFPIASDMTHSVSEDYGVLLEDEGIALRGLFIVDPNGDLKYSVVHDLNVGRSTEEVLRVLKGLQSGGLCPLGWDEGDDLL